MRKKREEARARRRNGVVVNLTGREQNFVKMVMKMEQSVDGQRKGEIERKREGEKRRREWE